MRNKNKIPLPFKVFSCLLHVYVCVYSMRASISIMLPQVPYFYRNQLQYTVGMRVRLLYHFQPVEIENYVKVKQNSYL